jgi:hypothetical protein
MEPTSGLEPLTCFAILQNFLASPTPVATGSSGFTLTPVPEPSTALLLAFGLAGLAAADDGILLLAD